MRITSINSAIQTIPWRKLKRNGTLVRFQGALGLWHQRAGITAFDGRYWGADILDKLNAKIEVLPAGCSIIAVQK